MTDKLNLPDEFRDIEQAVEDWFDEEKFKGGTPVMAYMIPDMTRSILAALSDARDEAELKNTLAETFKGIAQQLRIELDAKEKSND